MTTTREQILKAIEQLGATEAERAKKIGFTVRTIDKWHAGKGLRTIERLVDAGVLKIAEPTATDIAAN
jgi:hypothetical protein